MITVLSTEDEYVPKSLSDLTWEDIVPNKESGGFLLLSDWYWSSVGL